MLNHKDSKDLVELEFPDLIFKNGNLVNAFNHLTMETNKARTIHLVSKAKQILNFAHYLFGHSEKYVQLLLIGQFYKKLGFIQCELGFCITTSNAHIAEMQQLPFHISYRCTSYHGQFQLICINIK